VLPVLPVKNTL